MRLQIKRILSVFLCVCVLSVFSGCDIFNTAEMFYHEPDLTASKMKAPVFASENTVFPDKYFTDISEYVHLPARDFYCYGKLNSLQKTVYNLIYSQACNLDISDMYFYGASEKDVMLAYYAVCADNPQLFWLGDWFISEFRESENKTVLSLSGTAAGGFMQNRELVDSKSSEMYSAICDIFSKIITPDMSKYQMELAVHDWLCDKVTYNEEAAADDTVVKEDNFDNWTAYGAIVNRSAVCEGYAEAFQLMMYYLGINCTVIIGDEHMWNAVELDDGWYYVDATWDDSKTGRLEYNHSFFNADEKIMESSHEKYFVPDENTSAEELRYGSFNLFCEECTSTQFNYYRKEGRFIEKRSRFGMVVTPVLQRAWNGQRAVAEFAFGYCEADPDYVLSVCDSSGVTDDMLDHTNNALMYGSMTAYDLGSYGAFAVQYDIK